MSLGYCSSCGKDTDGQSRGRQHWCRDCKHFTNTQGEEPQTEKFSTNGETATYTVTSDTLITNQEELILALNIDTNVWNVDRWEIGTSNGYRKDKQVDMTWVNGKANGYAKDSGKLVKATMYSVKVWLSRKTQEIRSNLMLNDFIEKAKVHAPKYSTIEFPSVEFPHLLEIAIPDMQLGRVEMAEQAGTDINPRTQLEKATLVIDKLLARVSNFQFDRILFPIGNDFFDTNSSIMATKAGTPMNDDVRWQKTYRMGCDFMVETIDKLSSLAPVDVIVIPGNHDEDKMFHLGEYLDAWYHFHDGVTVNNTLDKRKYYVYGSNLIGLTHGNNEKWNELQSIMAFEQPYLWAESTHREWHLGDKHHKSDMVTKTDELKNGVVVRIFRSLADLSTWEHDKGFLGSLKAGEALVWHPEEGVISQATASA